MGAACSVRADPGLGAQGAIVVKRDEHLDALMDQFDKELEADTLKKQQHHRHSSKDKNNANTDSPPSSAYSSPRPSPIMSPKAKPLSPRTTAPLPAPLPPSAPSSPHPPSAILTSTFDALLGETGEVVVEGGGPVSGLSASMTMTPKTAQTQRRGSAIRLHPGITPRIKDKVAAVLGSVCGACVGLLEDVGEGLQPWVALITGAPGFLQASCVEGSLTNTTTTRPRTSTHRRASKRSLYDLGASTNSTTSRVWEGGAMDHVSVKGWPMGLPHELLLHTLQKGRGVGLLLVCPESPARRVRIYGTITSVTPPSHTEECVLEGGLVLSVVGVFGDEGPLDVISPEYTRPLLPPELDESLCVPVAYVPLPSPRAMSPDTIGPFPHPPQHARHNSTDANNDTSVAPRRAQSLLSLAPLKPSCSRRLSAPSSSPIAYTGTEERKEDWRKAVRRDSGGAPDVQEKERDESSEEGGGGGGGSPKDKDKDQDKDPPLRQDKLTHQEVLLLGGEGLGGTYRGGQGPPVLFMASTGATQYGLGLGLDSYGAGYFRVCGSGKSLFIPIHLGTKHFASLPTQHSGGDRMCVTVLVSDPDSCGMQVLHLTGSASLLWTTKESCFLRQVPDCVLHLSIEHVTRHSLRRDDKPMGRCRQAFPPSLLGSRSNSLSGPLTRHNAAAEEETEDDEPLMTGTKDASNGQPLLLASVGDMPDSVTEDEEEEEEDWMTRNSRPFVILGVQHLESKDGRTASFYCAPLRGGFLPPIEPGRYVHVRVSVNGEPCLRAYSLSGATNRYYRITVKRVPGGAVSNWLLDEAGPGTVLAMTDPLGHLTLPPIPYGSIPRPALLISAGIGLTPFMCMLQHHLSLPHPARRPIILLHADKTQDTLAFTPFLIEQAARGKTSKLSIHLRLSNPPPDTSPETQLPRWLSSVGRVDGTCLRHVLQKQGYCLDDVSGMDVMLCGPMGFMRTVYSILRHELQIPAGRIKYEHFRTQGQDDEDNAKREDSEEDLEVWLAKQGTPHPAARTLSSKDEGMSDFFFKRVAGSSGTLRAKSLDDGETMPAPMPLLQVRSPTMPLILSYDTGGAVNDEGKEELRSGNSHTQVTVEFQKSKKTGAWRPGKHKDILSFGEQLGVKIPYDCRVGTCGTCSLKVVGGRVDAPLGKRKEVRVCCTKPVVVKGQTNHVILDF